MLRCYYDDPVHRPLRPHCEGVAIIAYGPTRLCGMCDAMRSSVGKGTVARPLPGAELTRPIAAAAAAADAANHLDRAACDARHAGASWTQIGDAVGLTRQAAHQRWGRQ